MLAGKIRLKTFMVGVGAVVGVASGVLVAGMASCGDAVTSGPSTPLGSTTAASPSPSPQPTRSPKDTPPITHPHSDHRDDHASVVMAAAQLPLDGEKGKDVTAGKTYKVNLYQDEGKSKVNRAKVDLDRDGRWDEKWTLDEGSIQRQIATKDDENYDLVKTWTGKAWVGPGEEPRETPVELPGMREIDRLGLNYVGKNIGTDKLKDVTKGKPFKINVYQDAGNSTANRVKLDLDRDDGWDEQWTIKGTEVTRAVAPADDGNFTVEYTLGAQGWVAVP